MNSCMKAHATAAEQDAAREEWFAQRLERQRERERKERRKSEQEAFLREWWGLPEKDREARRLEEEKLRRAERVGGFASRDRRRWDEGVGAADVDAGSSRQGGGR
jgi:COX assembly protein 1